MAWVVHVPAQVPSTGRVVENAFPIEALTASQAAEFMRDFQPDSEERELRVEAAPPGQG
jgi:hypothetical protein